MGCMGTVGSRGKLFFSLEWWGKTIFGVEFQQPIKIGVDLIRENL